MSYQTWSKSIVFGANVDSCEDMVVYNDKIYALNSNDSGKYGYAGVWEFTGATWSLSARFPNAITSQKSCVYNDILYVGTGDAEGTCALYSFDGTTWQLVVSCAFTNQDVAIESMTIYDDKLYIGTRSSNNSIGPGVFYYDGTNMFLSQRFPNNNRIKDLAVYQGKIYAGLGHDADNASVWVSPDGVSSWANSKSFYGFEAVRSLMVYKNCLYAGLGQVTTDISSSSSSEVFTVGGADLWQYNGTDWTHIYNFGSLYHRAESLVVHQNLLYIGLENLSSPAAIYTYDGVNTPVLNSDDFGAYIQIESLLSYNGQLYAGIGRSDGAVWVLSQMPLCLVNQPNNNTLIPFTWISEQGYVGSGPYLPFTINSVDSSYGIIETYVPEEPFDYEHRSRFYVDVIGKDTSGIKDYRIHVLEEDKYEFQEIDDNDNVFLIPKFTWTNSNVASNASSYAYVGDLWVGGSDGKLSHLHYTNQDSSITSTNTFSSAVDKIIFANNSSGAYISTQTDLYIYNIDAYANIGSDVVSNEITEVISVDSLDTDTAVDTNRDLVVLYDGQYVWSTQSYLGNVAKRNRDTLAPVKKYSGMDAPFKMAWSQYHNLYFVSGTHILWAINDITSELNAIYEINDYDIADFDVSDSGQICLVLNSPSKTIIRVLDHDLYTLLLNEEQVIYRAKLCKFCDIGVAGKFYVLVELYSTTATYTAQHYVFDCDDYSLEKVDMASDLAATTTTTTLPTTTATITVQYPNSGETIGIGDKVVIKWLSSKSIDDSVKIELYKDGLLYSLIDANAKNTGVYNWTVPETTDLWNRYKIKITWLTANSNASNSDQSDSDFTIAASVPVTTTTTTTKIAEHAIGIDYDPINVQVVIMLQSGLFALFSLLDMAAYGLFDSEILNAVTIASKTLQIEKIDEQSKVRVWVGSNVGTSDKWDSGVVDTSLTSMFYGGGPNLVSGTNYFVNIQVYSNQLGWSDVQVREFLTPKV